MENLITALGLINNYEVFIAICIGSFAGIIFGAIPGLILFYGTCFDVTSLLLQCNQLQEFLSC